MRKPVDVYPDGSISKEDLLLVLEKGLDRIYREELRRLEPEQIDELNGKAGSGTEEKED